MTKEWSGSLGLRNDGEQPLRVQQILTSCRCVSVEAPSAPIPPGETEEIVLHLDLQGLAGKFDQSADLYLEGGATPEVVIRVHGELIPEVEWPTTEAEFSDLAPGGKASKTLAVTTFDRHPIHLVPRPAAGFQVSSTPTATGADVTILAKESELPKGRLGDQDVIRFDCVDRPLLHPSLAVSWTRLCPAVIKPTFLLFQGSELREQVIEVQRLEGRPWKLRAIVPPTGKVQARVIKDDGKCLQLGVSMLGTPEAPQTVLLKLQIEDPFVRELVVPVRWR